MRNVKSKYSPDIICKICKNMMYQYENNGGKMTIKTPAIWRNPRNHSTECFACNSVNFDITHKTRKKADYNYGYSCTPPIYFDKEEERPVFDSKKSDLDYMNELMNNLMTIKSKFLIKIMIKLLV